MKLTLMIVLILLALVVIGAGLWLYDPDRSRAALEAKYHVAPTDYVLAAGVRLHVEDTGPKDRPAVILLHGFGSNLFTWEPWARLLEKDYRVVRLDLPGFGLTGADPTGSYTDERSMEVLAALMDRLALPRASLVGNSMGGRIAWMFASRYPERVTRLVLIAPDGFASPGVPYGTKAKLPAMARLMRYTLPTPLIRMSLAPAYGDPKLLSGAVVARYRDLMLAPGVRDAILARMDAGGAAGPAAPAAPHQGPHPAALGREGRDDPVQQRRRLSAGHPRRHPGLLPRPRPRALRGGAGAHRRAGRGLPCGKAAGKAGGRSMTL